MAFSFQKILNKKPKEYPLHTVKQTLTIGLKMLQISSMSTLILSLFI